MPDILELYDEEKRPLGKTFVRENGARRPAGTYIIVVSVMTRCSDGRILLTQRAPEKSYAGKWEITGGAKVAGETAPEAACRELMEETGIHAEPSELTYCGCRKGRDIFHELFLLQRDVTLEEIRLQLEETIAARLVTPAEALALAEAGKCCGPARELFLQFYPAVFRPAE